MRYKEAYKYNTGEMVFTFTGDVWFMLDVNDVQTEIDKPDMSKVVFKL